MSNSKQTTVCMPLTEGEKQIILYLRTAYLSDYLKTVHDLALYHSGVPIEEDEKIALFNVNDFRDKLILNEI